VLPVTPTPAIGLLPSEAEPDNPDDPSYNCMSSHYDDYRHSASYYGYGDDDGGSCDWCLADSKDSGVYIKHSPYGDF